MRIPAQRHMLLLLLLAALALSACGADGNADKAGPKKRPAPVAVAAAELRDLPVSLGAVGAVQAAATVSVKSQVGGLIVRQFVRDGQEVKAGEVLFQIDPRPFQAEMAEARAQIERSQVLLKKAEEDLARSRSLRDRAVISQQEFDQARTDADALRASIRLYEAQLEKARLDLENAAIRAPIAGAAGEVKVNEGNVIKANDDRDLVVIRQVRPIFAAFAVPEAYLPEIARRMRAGEAEVLALPAGPAGGEDRPAAGRLASMDNTVDRATGTIRLKAEFANADGRLWPGQFVRVTVRLDVLRNAVTAPSAAIQTGIKGPYVYVVDANSTAELRQVETGLSEDGIAVVTSGLAAGEKVVVDGHLLLTPGAAVTLKTGKAAPAPDKDAPAPQAGQGAKQ
ncbi:MAG: efflux RND transporter periplasmic adaptor subunit [Thermodesulfobacteriota bacterium]